MVGRPVIWGLATSGETGVSRVLGTLQVELITAMRLAGSPSLEDIEQRGLSMVDDAIVGRARDNIFRSDGPSAGIKGAPVESKPS
uniref:alpha-hydroxy-acid oxidizing protein n=1 Tax=Orrella sp. TaxID=1921583 RepID=UPI004047F048